MFDEDDSRRFARHLPPVEAPDSIWTAIQAGLNSSSGARTPGPAWRPRLAAGLAVMAVLAAFALWFAARRTRAWEVVRLDGTPSVGSRHIAATGKIREGEWLQTDAASRAEIKVGAIGIVDVEPNTRVRLTAARPSEHRLMLARGDIRATVSAPPRLFLVDTSASTAVDLGCAYTLHVEDSGSGVLRVTLGSVSLEWEGRESLVPAGAMCRTRPHAGPGTPYFEDASSELKAAVGEFDADGEAPALARILAESRPRDTLTLWHLLSRVDGPDRGRVLDRIVTLEPSLAIALPRAGLLGLDRKELDRLQQELGRLWR